MEIYNEDFDFEDYEGQPEKVICVYFVPRSGSNFLADEMRKTGFLGYPLEYFSGPNMARLRKRMSDLTRENLAPLLEKRTSPNGVFSFKWNSNYGAKPIITPDYRIFIDRIDLDAQAKSFVIAEKTRDWLKVGGMGYGPSQLEIISAKNRLAEMRAGTLKMLEGEEFKRFFLEDLIKDSEGVISDILEYVGIEEENEDSDNS